MSFLVLANALLVQSFNTVTTMNHLSCHTDCRINLLITLIELSISLHQAVLPTFRMIFIKYCFLVNMMRSTLTPAWSILQAIFYSFSANIFVFSHAKLLGLRSEMRHIISQRDYLVANSYSLYVFFS